LTRFLHFITADFASSKQLLWDALRHPSVHLTAKRIGAGVFTLVAALFCLCFWEASEAAELFGGDGRARTIFNRAQGGTVVLEEVNELPLRL